MKKTQTKMKNIKNENKKLKLNLKKIERSKIRFEKNSKI
jgi:hypothetical protein